MRSQRSTWWPWRRGVLISAAWLGVLSGCLAYGSEAAQEKGKPSYEKGSRAIRVTVIGGTDNLVLRDPQDRFVTLDSTSIPGATMYRDDGKLPNVEATVAEVNWPSDGQYKLSGTARDSTWLGLDITGSVDRRGRCLVSAGSRVKRGEGFRWKFEYRAVSGDSCEVTVIKE